MTIPDGFVSRAAANKRFNRSQRALERDLDVALTTEDLDELAHWKLVTKDDRVFDASDVTTEQVKELVATGMVPVWCVEKAWLAEKYGERGTSPRRRQQSPPTAEPVVATPSDESTRPTNTGNPVVESFPSSPDNLDFLKQRIQILEREKQQEQARHDRVVEKLFEQLDVKDKQISAWDEVTQGLTKGLATGQLRVDRDAQLTAAQADATESRDVQDVEVVPAADNAAAKSTTKKQRPSAKPGPKAKTKSRAKRGAAKKKKTSVWQTEINLFPFRRK